jgi:hypothetical protein
VCGYLHQGNVRNGALLDPGRQILVLTHREAEQEPARPLPDRRASPEGAAAIGAYEVNGEELFHPSAAAPR